MRTRITKLICALMACAMIFTAAIPAFADDAKSVFCGEKVTWAVTDGVLKISGTGPMNSYTAGKAPWAGENYTSVVIESGVASIGNYAFAGSAITSVTIPAGVNDIGVGAFADCTALTKVVIPEGVSQIRNLTFAGCTKLNSVTLPATVARIGNMAFEGCTALAAITLPAAVNYIGAGAFNECSALTTITIPEGVKEIGFKTFGYCTALTKVVFPATVKTIDPDAFTGSTKLTITAPANSNAHAFATANKITFTQSGSIKVEDDNYAWANPFKDIDETAWYYDGVKYVNVNGIMVGTAADTFSPRTTLNNEQLATMIYRYAEYKKYDTKTEGELTYSDKKRIHDWAATAVIWADEKGIMTGSLDGTFGPAKDATRGQAADVFAKFMIEFK